jgi:FkbM family methyltransferase
MKLRRPIATGADWALVRLASGEYLCVDTSTFEALGYILGWEHEADVIRVFRTFLTQRSVVLDIGANFGLYTALSASIVKIHGRLYAFEGNPCVFECLQRTIVANDLYFNPNIVAANLLISSQSGRGLLHYSANWPSGGTMSDVALSGGMRRTVEVEMTTIDDFLPSDLVVDLVKIDVEGHEPLVLRGMERTIARSPNIRVVMEFADNLLAHTEAPADFIEYIRGLGFAICCVLPDFKIRLVPSGETLTGFNYCLLTRTPEEDIRAVYKRRKYLPIRFKRWLHRHPARLSRYGRIWGRW